MQLILPPTLAGYRQYLQIKALPRYKFTGRSAWFPDEYASQLGIKPSTKRERKYTPPDWMFDYQRDLSTLAIRKQKYCLFCDCLGGETIINSPDGDITIGDAFHEGKRLVVYTIKDGKVRTALSSAPFISGYNQLYEYVFQSGKRIVATKGHRFLSSSGWKKGSSLLIGERLLVSDASRLLSTSESCLSTYDEDGLHLTGTVPDLMDRYSPCFHQCDEQLLMASNSVSALLPSPTYADVQSRSMSHADEMGSKSEYIHRHPYACHHAIGHFFRQAVTKVGVLESQPHAFGSALFALNTRTCQTFHEGTNLAWQDDEFHPLADEQCEVFQFLTCDDSIVYDTLTAVNYIRDDVFYDIEVPETHCYLANGVWSHNCGMGKTAIMLEHARYAAKETGRPFLIISPLMVIPQTINEAKKFFGSKYKIEQVAAKDLQAWMHKGSGVGITNYEAIKDELEAGNLGGISLDESSMLKSHYGKWGTKIIELGKGLPYKLAGTGTPAPNDRIEYANHAVFMDAFPTVNSFLAKFFINRGETSERWELKAHAVKAFYLSMSDWSIFLVNPATYGWKDNTKTLPPIHVSVEDVGLTDEQTTIARTHDNGLFVGMNSGGIVNRSKMGQLAKGKYNGKSVDTLKPEYIAELCSRYDESVIVWCKYNDEQDKLAEIMPDAGNIDGSTPYEERADIIKRFQSGKIHTLISKPKIMGFGLNLQVCTRMIFSGLHDSYEEYYQAVKRSNRYGSTKPLHVHIPVTELERPMVENVLRKAKNVQHDTEEQERIFKELGNVVIR